MEDICNNNPKITNVILGLKINGFGLLSMFFGGFLVFGSTYSSESNTPVPFGNDDLQTEGSYGRVIVQIHCNGVSLNESILEAGFGVISSEFCSKSEFAVELWAEKFGCN